VPRTSESSARISRRSVLQGGAVAAGLVWTAPVAKTIRLGTNVGTPPPPTDPTYVTVTTPTTQDPPDPVCELTTRTGCTTIGGSYDIVFRFTGITPGRAVDFRLDFLSGSTVPTTTMSGTADAAGVYQVKPSGAFPQRWSARVALLDATSSAPLLTGSFAVERRCGHGAFVPD
jgi:hypothetical protein